MNKEDTRAQFGQYLYYRGLVGVQTIALALRKQEEERGWRKIGTILLEDFGVFKSVDELDKALKEFEYDTLQESHSAIARSSEYLEVVLENIYKNIHIYDISNLQKILTSMEILRTHVVKQHERI